MRYIFLFLIAILCFSCESEDKLEKEIQLKLNKLETLKVQLGDNSLYQPQNAENLKNLQDKYAQLKEEIETKETAWLEASEKISTL